MKLRFIFRKKGNDAKVLSATVNVRFIKRALKERSAEIDSLQQYDRGEKIITPRDLSTPVRSL